jgi:hypothetical protein
LGINYGELPQAQSWRGLQTNNKGCANRLQQPMHPHLSAKSQEQPTHLVDWAKADASAY